MKWVCDKQFLSTKYHYSVKRVFTDCEAGNDHHGAKRRDVVRLQCQPMTDLAFHIPRLFGKETGYISIDCSGVLRTMRVLVSDISRLESSNSSSRPVLESAARHMNTVTASFLLFTRTWGLCWSRWFRAFPHTLSCDCWSSVTLRVKVICFFLHVYHPNKYKTLLLDALPIERGDTITIKGAFKTVCDYYGFNEYTIVTTDNASSNDRCFGAVQNKCKAHGLNTACMQYVSDTKRATQKLFLNLDERRGIRAFFATVEGACSALRGSANSSFVAWLEDNIESNPDLAGLEPTRPPKSAQQEGWGRLS